MQLNAYVPGLGRLTRIEQGAFIFNRNAEEHRAETRDESIVNTEAMLVATPKGSPDGIDTIELEIFSVKRRTLQHNQALVQENKALPSNFPYLAPSAELRLRTHAGTLWNITPSSEDRQAPPEGNEAEIGHDKQKLSLASTPAIFQEHARQHKWFDRNSNFGFDAYSARLEAQSWQAEQQFLSLVG
jgi:hypothetical protein